MNRPAATLLGTLTLHLAACPSPVDTETDPNTDTDTDTDVVTAEPRVDLQRLWSATSIPSKSTNGTGWWDFPWRDPDTWCSQISVDDMTFYDEDDTEVSCWDGEPITCYEEAGFRADGGIDQFVRVTAANCDNGRETEYFGETSFDAGTWSFVRQDGDVDVFRVAGQEWRMNVEPGQFNEFTVTVNGTTYTMTVQSNSW